MRDTIPGSGRRNEGSDRSNAIVLLVLRAVFMLALMAVGLGFVARKPPESQGDAILLAFIGVALLVVGLDVCVPRKSLSALSGVFFGLIVGLVAAYGVALIVDLVVEALFARSPNVSANLVDSVKLALGVACCYLSVSIVLQTKDDFRFVIPYVEFSKESKGARPWVLDTSVIIDGRIYDIAKTGILETELILPRFVLNELQTIADSGDKLKRARGRRGLDMLNKLQTSETIEITMLDTAPARKAESAGVDEMLVDLAIELGGRILTNDFNLNKTAQVRGVTVININDLANALKPVFMPGEGLRLKVIKPGEEQRQGVGYLEDGTMVVVEGGRDHIGNEVEITVTSVLQTSAGRMIFGRMDGEMMRERRRPRHQAGESETQINT